MILPKLKLEHVVLPHVDQVPTHCDGFPREIRFRELFSLDYLDFASAAHKISNGVGLNAEEIKMINRIDPERFTKSLRAGF